MSEVGETVPLPVEPDSQPPPSSAATLDLATIAGPDRSLGLGRTLATGAAWTMAGYGGAQVVRFFTSMGLTRILAPELFGIMMIVNTVRTGVELLSDIGISQSVIRSPYGNEPPFYNTAWTIQIARGLGLFAFCAMLAIPVGLIYNLSILSFILPAAALTLLISGFTSMSLPLLRRAMNFRVLAYFEIGTALAYSAFQLVIAYLYPTVWSLVLGLIFGSFVSVMGSFSLGHIRHRFWLDPAYIKEILSFGKWITASSAVFFVTANLDRMYLPSVLALSTLGVFAIARTITDVVNNIFVRLNNSILFPFVASRGQSSMVKSELAGTRGKFLFLAAASLGLLCATVDLVVFHLFDARYRDAGAMASILLCGTWFAILSSTAEASLLGLGRPQVMAIANGAKLVWLLAVLPVATAAYGIPAAIVAIAASDIVRYLATIPAQRRASFSFLLQDWCATAVVIAVAVVVGIARASFGMPLTVLGWLRV